jgi:hypothetical protein
MQCTTGWRKWQGEWGAIDHTVAVVMLVLLRIIGYQVEGLGGWLACPPRVIKLEEGRRPKGQDCGGGFAWRVGWAWMRESWVKAAVRSEVLLGLMFLMEWWEWEWVYLLPWGVWIWKGLGGGVAGTGARRVVSMGGANRGGGQSYGAALAGTEMVLSACFKLGAGGMGRGCRRGDQARG